jgi:hypothetical protein
MLVGRAIGRLAHCISWNRINGMQSNMWLPYVWYHFIFPFQPLQWALPPIAPPASFLWCLYTVSDALSFMQQGDCLRVAWLYVLRLKCHNLQYGYRMQWCVIIRASCFNQPRILLCVYFRRCMCLIGPWDCMSYVVDALAYTVVIVAEIMRTVSHAIAMRC